MTELGGQTGRITMGELRLDACKTRRPHGNPGMMWSPSENSSRIAGRFTASVQSIGGFERLLWPSARDAVAQNARRRDPGLITTGNPGECRLIRANLKILPRS